MIQSHAVYQQLNSQGRPDEFSLAMANNPITMRMDNDLARASLVTIADYQEFYSRYLSLWESELAVTLLDLNSYLSVEDAVALAAAQRQWEASVNTNLDLDQSIIESTGVELGFQYEPSVLLYLLQQYEARVYHIKYLIYLIENHVPAPDQLWDNFHHGT
ncbi:MAG: hypothetical protein LBE83_03300 [Propionibacteriaceae bacterium]|nr:hypothetical protein [Propionibacteriaceae bacterium]